MQLKFRLWNLSLLILSLSLQSCGDKKAKEQPDNSATLVVPVFNADSAFAFIEKQVAFGPRIPNTQAHRNAGDYLVRKLRSYGANVSVQEFKATTFGGDQLSLRNIIGSFNPGIQKRIILAAHWDTRPWSDKDPDKPKQAFDGANDGASGVGVLLEVARLMNQKPAVGIDIIFFDGEDWGPLEGSANTPTPADLDSWWCLGAQYWSKQQNSPGYRGYYGILLDMVGAPGAQFFEEGSSLVYAPKIVEKVWKTAARMGYSSTFVSQQQSAITDDHLFVGELASIPMVDITQYDPAVGYFGTYHHTQNDNLALISKETLGIVGRVVVQVIYSEEN